MSRSTWLRFLVLALIWGSSFLLIKVALEGLAPAQIVYGRLVTATIVLFVVLLLRRIKLPRDPRMWLHLALLGVVANVVPFYLFSWGEQHITSGLAGVLNGTTPLFTLAFAVVVLPEERLSTRRATGLCMGFAGVVLVVGPWDQNPLTSSIAGQLACLAAAVCYGVAFVYTRRYITPKGLEPAALAAVQLLAGTVLMTLALPAIATSPVRVTAEVAMAVLALGAVGTAIAYLLFYRVITDAGATTASLVTYLIPIVAVALGIVILGEPLTWNLFAGAAVVILGVAIADGRFERWRRLPAGETVDAPTVPPGDIKQRPA